MNTKMIEESWNSFRKEVIPANAPDEQVTAMKMAFYGGCDTLLKLTYELGSKNIAEDAAVNAMQSLHNEVNEYIKSIS